MALKCKACGESARWQILDRLSGLITDLCAACAIECVVSAEGEEAK